MHCRLGCDKLGTPSHVSGAELIKVLCNKFGFAPLRRKGSHMTLNKGAIYVTIPVKDIRAGLLNRILKDIGISGDELAKYL